MREELEYKTVCQQLALFTSVLTASSEGLMSTTVSRTLLLW